MVDVLIVDDRPDGLLSMEVALKRSGVNLIKASSGREALGYIKTHDFAVILLDVQMPELDGFQTAALIRKYPNYVNTPILFVTAISKDDAYVYKGYDAGAVDYIFKPFDPQVLRSKVAVFVDLYLAKQQLKDHERIDGERKIAELEVESLNRYRNLADSIPHIVWKAHPDGFFFYLNKVWLTYTGLTHEQSIGMGWQKSMHDEDLGKVLKVWLRAMDKGEPFDAEARLASKDGEMRWHLVRVIPELTEGKVTAWIGTCTDIHAVKLAEVRLIEAERVAVAANEAKTNFLANMSHEIRTPMGAILGFSESLLRHEMSEEKKQHSIQAIHRSGKQLLGLIDEILDISKVEAGRLDVEETNFDLLSKFTDLYTLMEVHARKNELKLDFAFTSEIPYSVFSDPTRLWQILVNVVGNAIKFTRKGRVCIEVHWADDRLRVKVMDTGIGIDRNSESMKLLFQPFSQLDTSTTRRFGGTGLGLYLSRRIATALGGDITLEEANEGWSTEFLIEIAAKADGELRPVPDIRSLTPEKTPAAPGKKTDLTGVKVLLVEDLIDNQELVQSFLASAGAKVDIADNGLSGVEKALANKYDVVLMDIQMPGLDGYQATAKLREAKYGGPIIALTAHALKEERTRSLAAGCTDHLTKPINYPLLVKRVAEYAKH